MLFKVEGTTKEHVELIMDGEYTTNGRFRLVLGGFSNESRSVGS